MNATSPQDRTKLQLAAAPRQFSVSALLLITSGYAVLCGLLRSAGCGNLGILIATLYVTAVFVGQVTLLPRRTRFEATFLANGILFAAAGVAADAATGYSSASFWFHLAVPLLAFPIGGMLGFGMLGIFNLGETVLEAVNPVPRSAAERKALDWDARSARAARSQAWCLAMFALLVAAFFAGVYCRCAGPRSLDWLWPLRNTLR